MPRAVEPLDLLYRLEAKARAGSRRAQRQFTREGHHLVERHAGGGDLAPTNLNAPAIPGRDVAVSLGRVEGIAAMARQHGSLSGELVAVERPQLVFAAGRGEQPKPLRGLSLHRQLKQIRALEKPLDTALELPLL